MMINGQNGDVEVTSEERVSVHIGGPKRLVPLTQTSDIVR